jgi:hypothetical protein
MKDYEAIQKLLNNSTSVEEDLLNTVKHNASLLQFLNSQQQTKKVCLEAVKQKPGTLKYVKNQTSEICLEAVKRQGYALRYVRNQTPEICMTAIKNNPVALQFVEKQTNKLCLEAVKSKGYCIRYVINKTYELELTAIKNDPYIIRYIFPQTEDLCLKAVERNGDALKFIENKTPKICLAALENDFKSYRHLPKNNPKLHTLIKKVECTISEDIVETKEIIEQIKEELNLQICLEESKTETEGKNMQVHNTGNIFNISCALPLMTNALNKEPEEISELKHRLFDLISKVLLQIDDHKTVCDQLAILTKNVPIWKVEDLEAKEQIKADINILISAIWETRLKPDIRETLDIYSNLD